MTANSLAFRDVTFDVRTIRNTTYITSAQLANALGYATENAVTKIYHRNADEFTEEMTVTQNGSDGQLPTRLFSLRGAHLVAMFARTLIAKEFRKWVLDVLDREIGQASWHELQPEIDVRTLLLENHYELVVSLPPELLEAIDKKAWEMAGESYLLFRDYLKRHTASYQYGEEGKESLYVNAALESIREATIGNALAHQFHKEIKGVKRSLEFVIYRAEKALREIQDTTSRRV